MKKYHPISIDSTETIQWIEDEIQLLKSLSLNNEYVINYLDSFVTIMGDDIEYKIYHIINDLYQVNI